MNTILNPKFTFILNPILTQYSTQYWTQYWTPFWIRFWTRYWIQYWTPILNPMNYYQSSSTCIFECATPSLSFYYFFLQERFLEELALLKRVIQNLPSVVFVREGQGYMYGILIHFRFFLKQIRNTIYTTNVTLHMKRICFFSWELSFLCSLSRKLK